MHAASQLPRKGPTDVDDAPAPACKSKNQIMMMMMMKPMILLAYWIKIWEECCA